MVRQSERSDCGKSIAAAVAFASLVLAGCAEERPAYVIDPDHSAAISYTEPHRTFMVTVHEGDSLSVIAERCGTTTDTLMDINTLDDARAIYPGEVLRVPKRPCRDYAELPRPEPRPRHAVTASYEPTRVRRAPERDASPAQDDRSTSGSWWSSWWNDTAGDDHADAGKFIWPVRGPVIGAFGRGDHGERNDGINIATADGTPIRAAASGIVTYAGNELRGYGNLVLIKHGDGYVTAYAHTGNIRVMRGDHVERGQVIATAGETGDVDRPQLHFEIRRGVEPVDPLHYLTDRAS